jgi:hypothetical protein
MRSGEQDYWDLLLDEKIERVKAMLGGLLRRNDRR